jgi:hypothetical protein
VGEELEEVEPTEEGDQMLSGSSGVDMLKKVGECVCMTVFLTLFIRVSKVSNIIRERNFSVMNFI